MSLPGALRASRSVYLQCHRSQIRCYVATAEGEQSRLPRVASPSFWTSLVPRFLRRPTTPEEASERARVRDASYYERRTGIIFLILGILVGSNAINIIAIRREMLNFSRQTDAKLELLREVVQRVKNGEEFDVKKALGTGDPKEEGEWEEVMRELEETDMLEKGRKKRDVKRAERAEQQRVRDEERRAARSIATDVQAAETPTEEARSTARPKFLM